MPNASSDQEKRIRERAYELWERDGRPEGRSQLHWEQAERETGASEADPASLPPPDVMDPPPPPSDEAGASEADPASMPPGLKPDS